MFSNGFVLCIDDNETALRMRKLVLQAVGYQVVTATAPDSALRLLATRPIKLVIVDYFLGQGTGTELAARMKQGRPNLPILLLSGCVEEPEGLQHVNAFMSKSEGPERLFELVSKLTTQSYGIGIGAEAIAS